METTRTRGRFSIPLADFSRAANGSSLEVAACGEQTELSEREIGLLRRFVEACAARDAAAQPTSGGEAATTPPSGGHDEVRAWLDARRDLVLGCTGGRAAFIRIGWDEAGAHVALGPPLAGTPEEACVVHGLGEVPDGSGDLIHPITP